jgi:hypothetical protein
MALKTRPPTGRVPWPLILLEGAEKSGKSWAIAELSASQRVGQTYWLDLGEGSADEYGAVPGARYLVVEHDGSLAQITAAVAEIRTLAQHATTAGEPPVVLAIDSMTAVWDLCKAIADRIARERLARKGRRLAEGQDPQISMDLWNDVNSKHRRLVTMLMTFPGIAVMTARGREVAALDDNGRPIEGAKEYRVEAQKGLPSDASVWVRMSRDHPPMVVGARSVHAGIRPGVDRPREMKDFNLDRLVFDVLRCAPAEAHVRDLVQPEPSTEDTADPTAAPTKPTKATKPAGKTWNPDEQAVLVTGWLAAIEDAPDSEALTAVAVKIRAEERSGALSPESAKQLVEAGRARAAVLKGGSSEQG